MTHINAISEGFKPLGVVDGFDVGFIVEVDGIELNGVVVVELEGRQF